jgi:hypothetical protein
MRNHESEKRVSANEPWPARYRALQIGGAFAIIRLAISTAVPALLAQLAEQLTLNQRVVGSSPTGGISVSRRRGTSEGDHAPSFPVPRVACTQKHSIRSSRLEPTRNGSKRLPRATECATAAYIYASGATIALPSDLSEIASAWMHLPKAIRVGILAIVRTSKKTGD